jgi:hypothetical protein
MPDGYPGEPPVTTECLLLVQKLSFWWEIGKPEHSDMKSIYLMVFEKLSW